MQVLTRYFPAGEVDPAQLPAGWDSESTLVLAFSGLPAAQIGPALRALRQAFPQARIAGCSAAGEVIGSTVRDGGLAVAVTRFDHTGLRLAQVEVSSPDASYGAGSDLARQLRAPDLAGVLVYSDGLHVNGSQLVRGLSEGLGEGVPVTGGMAGDDYTFAATWVISDDRPTEGVVIGVGLYGDAVLLGYGCDGGWDTFGPPRTITRSVGNVVEELDGEPALDLYERYLGEFADGLPASGVLFPLAIAAEPDGDALVRAMIGVDRQQRTVTFGADVPQGWTAQLMRANVEHLVDGAARAAARTAAMSASVPPATTAATTAATAPGGQESLTIVVTCSGRRLVLKERVEEELEAVADGLPAGAQRVGFYSYGEISPLANGRCELHNQTMALTILSERPK